MKLPKRKSTRRSHQKAAAPPNDAPCSIGELAGRLRITQRTIRFYESRGLIAPGRNGAQRVYSAADETRLKLILRTKNLGLSLEDIARHLTLYERVPVATGELKVRLADVEGAIELLDAKLADLQAAIADLRKIRGKCAAGLRRGR